jgi:hypothetical protein
LLKEAGDMLRNAASKVMWVGRATVFVVGLAVIVALVLGVATAALGANGDVFRVGQSNFASAVSVLDKSGAGPALRLLVDSGAPLAVNSSTKVSNLNADRLDGKHATQIGVNGLQEVVVVSASDSDSPKSAQASCPAGKRVVGTGYDILGGKSGAPPNEVTDVVVDEIEAFSTFVEVLAYEEEPSSSNWSVTVSAICATAP